MKDGISKGVETIRANEGTLLNPLDYYKTDIRRKIENLEQGAVKAFSDFIDYLRWVSGLKQAGSTEDAILEI